MRQFGTNRRAQIRRETFEANGCLYAMRIYPLCNLDGADDTGARTWELEQTSPFKARLGCGTATSEAGAWQAVATTIRSYRPKSRTRVVAMSLVVVNDFQPRASR